MVAIGRCGTGPLSHHSKRSKADQVCNRNLDLTLKDQLFLHVPTILVSSTRKESKTNLAFFLRILGMALNLR